jgi:hypothetical protein
MDWVNSQRLSNPLSCLRDGHDLVGNLFCGNRLCCMHNGDKSEIDITEEKIFTKLAGLVERLKQAEVIGPVNRRHS